MGFTVFFPTPIANAWSNVFPELKAKIEMKKQIKTKTHSHAKNRGDNLCNFWGSVFKFRCLNVKKKIIIT